MGAGKIQNGLVVPGTCVTVTSRHYDRWERSLYHPPPTLPPTPPQQLSGLKQYFTPQTKKPRYLTPLTLQNHSFSSLWFCKVVLYMWHDELDANDEMDHVTCGSHL